MQLNEFKRVFKRDINFFVVTPEVILFKKPLHVWDSRTEETFKYKTLDDALEHVVDGKKLIEYIEGWDGQFQPMYGSGGSKSTGEKKFKPMEGDNRPSHTTDLLPAKMNTATFKGRVKANDDEAIQAFAERHRNSPVEYTTTVDSMGYAYHYGEGQSGAVIPRNVTKGSTVIHNHPKQGDGKDYNNFSGQDIAFISQSQGRRIIAVGQNGEYSFTKGAKFDSAGMMKALKRTISGKTYDEAMGNFLEKNQKKYGYTYSFTPKAKASASKVTKAVKQATKPKTVAKKAKKAVSNASGLGEQLSFDF